MMTHTVLGCSEFLALERVSLQRETAEPSFATVRVIEPVCGFLGQVKGLVSLVQISGPGSPRK